MRHGLSVGSPMSVVFAKTGSTRLRVAAIFSDDTFGSFFVSLTQYRLDFTAQEDQVILVAARPGHARRAPPSWSRRGHSGPIPISTCARRRSTRRSSSGRINTLLRLFYALLAMAVVIAIFGIVLTLALSVFERTREIGLLRAVGLSRSAVRAMIRWEAIVVALIGALVGLVLGLFLGTVSVAAIPEFKAIGDPMGIDGRLLRRRRSLRRAGCHPAGAARCAAEHPRGDPERIAVRTRDDVGDDGAWTVERPRPTGLAAPVRWFAAHSLGTLPPCLPCRGRIWLPAAEMRQIRAI